MIIPRSSRVENSLYYWFKCDRVWIFDSTLNLNAWRIGPDAREDVEMGFFSLKGRLFATAQGNQIQPPWIVFSY